MDSHFFDDLGMSSLLVAHFCARARERAESPPLSVKDVYLHPTIRSLAAAVTELPAGSWRPGKPAGPGDGTARQHRAVRGLRSPAAAGLPRLGRGSPRRSCPTASPGFPAARAWRDIYLRSLAFSAGAFSPALRPAYPGQVDPGGPLEARGRSRVWSLPYLRFWLVKTLIQANPLALFTGSPVYSLYLRALGARIGRRVVIFSSDRAGLHRPARHRR